MSVSTVSPRPLSLNLGVDVGRGDKPVGFTAYVEVDFGPSRAIAKQVVRYNAKYVTEYITVTDQVLSDTRRDTLSNIEQRSSADRHYER